MAVHGDITEINVSHPTVGSFTLFPKANEDNTIDTGGFRNNDDSNQITGNGELILQKNKVRGSIECIVENDANTREDLEKMVAVCNSPELAEWTYSHVSGAVWKITGQPVGDLQSSLNTGVFTLKVVGNVVTKIAG